ncbi:malto-oligosyltrehalose synthase [Mucilaginibacter sp.]|uniref:malto-oligosyltrehalose synthase n=1 Tax=Mucilaginibacter sp. TaxID=1882438 RepID=UPI0025FE4D0B|nr:malto-oligosyltrehalose synthase [Mucilaginibacter sp.]
MHNPVATYRIQFNKNFTFNHLKAIIPYLQQLGISTLYASPIFEAAPGSTHGYDVVNPLVINPEIGSLQELELISKTLKKHNISWLQDIVPNHMAYHQSNKWLMDVLEKGKRSEYVDFFDIIWSAPIYNSRLMVPFLGEPFEDALKDGQIKIVFKENSFAFTYGEQYYPLNLHAYITILQITKEPNELITLLIAEAKELQQADDNISFGIRFTELKEQLASIYKHDDTKKFIQASIDKINKDTSLLQQISSEQYYQLCFWQETEKQINFRRFFTVNGLICLNMQLPKVFDKYHELIKSLLDKDIVQGLRLDHIDGLYDPAEYLERLRALTGNETYIVVEKILEDGEKFPDSWPVQGSTGYDFLAAINNLFTQTENKKAFADFYREFTKEKQPITKAIFNKKSLILHEHMAGELENLYQLFCDLELADQDAIKTNDIKTVIAEFLIRCPVYRYYGNSFPLPLDEQKAVTEIFKSIRDAKPELEKGADMLQNILIKENDDDVGQRILQFYQRCMQFTGPLMAKGVEDTLMYTYDRFIGHNEVGDTPKTFGLLVDEFHSTMIQRQQQYPLAINATSTHDTKRGEGVRARLNVLTDLAEDWLKMVAHWQNINSKFKTDGAPDANDEYLLYQSITGSFPMPGEDDDFLNRLQEYLIKGLREAKRHTQWAEPNEKYEESCKRFIESILQPQSDFNYSFQPLLNKIADYGIINSLAQTILKFTCPGTPDVYQGCEYWDLSMVDPDNRRPVDYELRANNLNQLTKDNVSFDELWNKRQNANIKLWLTQLLFGERKNNPIIFEKGLYIPLAVTGKYEKNIMAFARQYQGDWYIVIIPLHLAQISPDHRNPGSINWEDTHIELPVEAPLKWHNLLCEKASEHNLVIKMSTILDQVPFALLKNIKL